MRLITIKILFFVTLLVSCNRIETNTTLNKKTIEQIEKLGLLEKNETIIKYYSNYRESKAGNFYTDKRIAHYWIDENNTEENDTSFAFYNEIKSIDTVYNVPDTYSPYMKITKNDGTEFRVFIEGKHAEKKQFFEGAIRMWKKKKNAN